MSMSLRSKSKVDSTPRLTRSQAAAALASSSNANTPPPTSAPRSQRSKVIDEENSKPASKAASKDTGKKGKGKGKVAVKEDPVVADSAETAPTKSANTTRSRVKAQPKTKTRTSARRKSTKKEGDKVEEPAIEEGGEGGEKDEKMDEDNEDSGDLSEEVYCICKGKDDGSPMIKCEGDCQNWYHFGCISMSEDDADRVALYICPECEARTGKKTQWEDKTSKRTDEPDNETGNEAKDVQMDLPEPTQKKELKEEEDESEGEGEGSGDDYVAETERIGTSRKRSVSMRKKSISSHKALSSSETSDSDDNSRPRRLIRGQPRPKRLKRATSKSPAPESHISTKRRASTAAILQQSESKRAKTEDDANERGGKDDPVRKYCLGKLEEVIVPIFLEALMKKKEVEKGKEEKSERIEDGGGDGGGDTHAPTESSTAVGVEAAESGIPSAEQESSQQKSVEKEEENFVSDEEKKEAEAKASAFVAALERCMFDTYAEPDKTGRLVASGKYKERFRTLHFNLGKHDRVLLRRDIAAERIQPSQLNTMSSTDLADEKTKQEIEIFEKEALEHSTLTTITAPRAKITHKGFEDIEDVTGMGQRNQDALREEEERMERERRERARLASTRTRVPSQGSPTTGREHASMSPGLPLSPITPTSATPWGAPPPLPLHAIHVDDAVGVGSGLGAGMIIGGRLHPRPLFVPSASDFGSSMEGGLNLADLINIDDDLSTDEVVEKSQTSNQPRAETESTASMTPEVITPSGPSPFVVNLPAESPRRASFDLNSLWSAQSKEADKTEAAAEKPKEDAPKEDKQEPASVARVGDAERSDSMELDSTEEQETKDQDFDMFLKEDGGGNGEAKIAGPSTPVKEDIDVESLTQVWVGAISMPRDNNTPLAPGVSARQVGGRTLDLNSGLWNVLFPSTAARIDGRVPVDKSSPYLVSMRLNSAKELVAVCFVPTSDNERPKYDELISFLLGKGRHALCFPWGEHPKPNAPGRELYIIPLLHDQPIPEYIELLDDLRLPKTRKSNLLIGVFVLNKGKLVAPPSLTTAPPPAQLTPPLASLPFVLPTSAPQTSTSGVPPVLPTALVGVNPAALAAEVASLTPEQISLMLRQLTQAQGPPPQPPNSAPPPNHVPPPHTYPGMPPLPGNFGSSPPPPPNGGYPSYGQPPPPHPPYQRQLSPPGHGRRESYDDYDNYDDGYSGRPYGRDDRGRGGRGRGYDRDHRGRGRGGNRGRGRPYDRDQGRYHDSGWSARARSPPDYTRGARFD